MKCLVDASRNGRVSEVRECFVLTEYLREHDHVLVAAAVSTGKLQMVKLLLRLGCSVNETCNLGNTPFHAAAASKQIDMMRFLLECQREVDGVSQSTVQQKNGISTNKTEETPMCVAIRHGDMDMMRLLHMQLVRVSVRDFFNAIRHGQELVVRELLKPAYNLVENAVKYPEDAVAWAATHGHEGVLTLLIEDGRFSIDGRTGRPPLHAAVQHKQSGAVKILTERGCDINRMFLNLACGGETAVLLSAKLLCATLCANEFDEREFEARLHMLQLLMELQCDVRIADEYGTDVLSYITNALAVARARHGMGVQRGLGDVFQRIALEQSVCVC